jgi:hypothetical protein
MDHREQRAGMHQPMQPVPAPGAEPAHRAVPRGRGERREAAERDGADRQIEAQHAPEPNWRKNRPSGGRFSLDAAPQQA